MTKDPLVYLDYILECIQIIESQTKKVTFARFLESIPVQDVILRRIQIIGQAVKSLPQNIKSQYPRVSWKEIAGMRDKLVHDYMEIDFELTWGVVEKDLPILKKQIAKIKSDIVNPAGKF